MFLHEFGEDFVLALQLLFQQGDPPVLVVAGAAGAVLECGSGVLEELLLPTVEHRGVNAVLVAQIRHRGVFEEMEPKYGDLLRGAEAIPSFLGHGKTSARDCSLFERLVLPIPTEAKHITPLMGCCSVPIFTRCSTCICLAFNQKHLRLHSIRSLSVTATVTSGARDCGFLRSFVQVLRHLEFGGGGSTIIFVVPGVFERTDPLSEDGCSVLDGDVDRVERVEWLTFAQANLFCLSRNGKNKALE